MSAKKFKSRKLYALRTDNGKVLRVTHSLRALERQGRSTISSTHVRLVSDVHTDGFGRTTITMSGPTIARYGVDD